MYGSVTSKMEVTVIINLGGSPKEVTQSGDPEQTVKSFVHAVCQNHNIPNSGEAVLSSEDGVVFKMSQTLSYYGIQDGSVVRLVNWTTGYKGGCGCNQWWLLSAVAFLIGAAGIAAVIVIKLTSGIPNSYGIVFDAGSSHTQMYIYKWEGDKENGTAVPYQIYSKRAEGGGISDYADNPSQAGESLRNLVQDARKQIPGSQYTNTDIYLGATAGMRLLRAKNETESDAIMTSIRDTLLKTPFQFSEPETQSRIIDGKEEGSYGWVTVNYLDNKFEIFDKKDTYGSLDLGGASTQITFVPNPKESVDENYMETLVLYGFEYDVYTHSYLCYGSNEAHRKYLATLVLESEGASEVTDPCLPKGNTTVFSYDEVFEAPCTNKVKPANKTDFYAFEGSSDSEKCNEMAHKIFNFSAPCGHTAEKCTFNGVYQPALAGEFKAFSQFYYTMQFLNVSEGATLDQFRNATADFCKYSWYQIKDLVLPPSVLKFVTQYCFNAHYIDILLTKGYKFDAANWERITFTNKIQNTELGWSLGFMTNTSNTIAAQQPSDPIHLTMFIIYTILFAVFLLLAIAFACHARQARRNPSETHYARLGEA